MIYQTRSLIPTFRCSMSATSGAMDGPLCRQSVCTTSMRRFLGFGRDGDNTATSADVKPNASLAKTHSAAVGGRAHELDGFHLIVS